MMIVPTTSLVVREQPADMAKIARFQTMLRAGSKPPPVRVLRYDDAATGINRRRWYVYDGHHRIAAARREGCLHVRAEVVTLNT